MTHPLPLNRRNFLLCAAAFVVATPAHADFVSDVTRELQRQGYTEISVSFTLLGRSRILARGKRGTREIILNPKTGEVLRDLWTSASGITGPSIIGVTEDDTTAIGSDDGSDDGQDQSGNDGSGGNDDSGGDDRSGEGENSGSDDGGNDD